MLDVKFVVVEIYCTSCKVKFDFLLTVWFPLRCNFMWQKHDSFPTLNNPIHSFVFYREKKKLFLKSKFWKFLQAASTKEERSNRWIQFQSIKHKHGQKQKYNLENFSLEYNSRVLLFGKGLLGCKLSRTNQTKVSLR